jgi:hypothetical protein
MKTFKHSGDMGDIIFSLPTIRALGGGVLYLDPKGGEGSDLIRTEKGNRTKLNSKSIESLKPLLELQQYIDCVKEWSGEPVDHNLDSFRNFIMFNNLADSHLRAFNFDLSHRDSRWISLGRNAIEPKSYYVFSRSCRYQGNHGYWGDLVRNFTETGKIKDTIFVGHKKEHELFEFTFDTKVNYVETKSMLDVAEVLSRAKRLYCNQSVIHAIGEGMKMFLTQEVYRPYPATVFTREGAEYV